MRELKYAVWNRYMVLSVSAAAFVLCMTFHTYQLWNCDMDVLELITYPMGLSGFAPFAALFPVLPYSLRFAEEYNTGYVRYTLLREHKSVYIRKKLIAAAVSGGVMMAGAFSIVFLLAWTNGVPAEVKGMEWSSYSNGMWYPLISVWGGSLVLILKTLLAFLFGSVWAMIALFVTTVFTNRYVAIVVTFLIYQLWWFADSPYNSVGLLLADGPSYDWVCANPFFMQLATLIVLFFVSRKTMERKLKYV